MPRLGMLPRTKKVKSIVDRKKIKISKKIFLLLIPIILIFLFEGASSLLKPTVFKLSESRAKSIGLKITNAVVNKYIKEISEKNIINIQKDTNGKITGLATDVSELNRISVSIANDVQTELTKVENSSIKIPLGTVLMPNTMFAGSGPSITVEIVPIGNVKTEFKTDFISAGINQTRHRITLDVTTNVNIIAPFVAKSSEFVNNILVSETVLLGDVPSSYYNLEGLNKGDTLNLMGQ